MTAEAPLAILICADEGLEKYSSRWPLDCAAAAENMLLAAHASGLGAVWVGVYPEALRMNSFRSLLGLPENILPVALIVIGHAQETPPAINRFRQERVTSGKGYYHQGERLCRGGSPRKRAHHSCEPPLHGVQRIAARTNCHPYKTALHKITKTIFREPI